MVASGGGIGGTVAAMALQKAGIEPVIFEAYGRSSEGVGAFLTLAGSGLQALQAIGMGPAAFRGAIDTAIAADQWRTELLELFERDATPAADIVRATPTIFRGWNTYDFPTVPRWHRDRMIIVGDAPHAASPASGQGASMAIEDAVVLAKCLRDVPGIEAAFAAWLFEHAIDWDTPVAGAATGTLSAA